MCASCMLAACSNTSNDSASNGPSPDNHSADSPSSRGASAVVLTDPQGDVESVGRRAEDFYKATPDPQQKHGDIVTSSVEHTATEVLVRIKLAYLVPPGPSDTYVARVAVETNEARRRGGRSKQQTWVSVSFGAWRGSEVERETLVTVDCPGLDHAIDYDHDEVTLSIPRTCLKDPEWVRVGPFFKITLDGGAITTLDDGLLNGYRQNSPDAFSARIPKP